ncbi:MAG: acyl carrier protein [Synergistaceae bacterium]|jgi:acyl carrier protein|nr:acyl carrier protein [Synergistaceae bacterium]
MKDRILGTVSEILGLDVNENMTMADIVKWDSLKTLQIIMALDEKDISIPLEKIAKVKSVKDLIMFAEEGE